MMKVKENDQAVKANTHDLILKNGEQVMHDADVETGLMNEGTDRFFHSAPVLVFMLIVACLFNWMLWPISFFVYFVAGFPALLTGVFFNWFLALFKSRGGVVACTALSAGALEYVYLFLIRGTGRDYVFILLAALCGGIIAWWNTRGTVWTGVKAFSSSWRQSIAHVIYFVIIGPWMGVVIMIFLASFHFL
ncbi:hypothetical protein [Saezia sanguinis]|uniref:hypothetical protein n=1 Tax=Saezia sanguinis TaxID=1965230 RepID=UPI00305D88EB